MGRVLLCVGKYADKPYFLERLYVNVYSAEELCYCLMQNAFLIGKEIVDEGLAEWLETECGQIELAAGLREMMKAGCGAAGFAGKILDDIGYGSREEIEKAKRELEKEADLSIHEKRMVKADYLTENRKYMSAIKCYDSVLAELPDGERALRGRALHNRGPAYAGLYRFRDAADSFRQAYEWGKREESYISFLAANRMFMEEREYVNFIALQPRGYEQTFTVEKRMEDAAGEFEGTEESRMLFTLKVCKEEDNSVSYYEEVERITDDLKEQYRQMAERCGYYI